ncbi:MAG TPA: ImmA/IrrE family metallo-endopeptidase [Terriglobales bacterium]|nr:ImmA/IrrE family metallo-endopeptidase [Terriglobales bacterium]
MTILPSLIGAGDPQRFRLEISFQEDPHGGEGASIEESLSWGTFQLWAEGRNLCDHVEAGEPIKSVSWYLLPLLEWLAENWDALLHEERLPNRNADALAWQALRQTAFVPAALEGDERRETEWERQWSGWWHRHALQSCRQGGLFPDLILRRWRDEIEISWGSSAIAGAPEHFYFTAPSGAARLDPQAVAESLYAVLDGASAYLSARHPTSARCRNLRRRVDSICSAAREDVRLSWLAGLTADLRKLKRSWQRFVEQARNDQAVFERLFEVGSSPLVIHGSCEAALMFGSFSPTITATDALTIARWMAKLTDRGGDLPKLKRLSRNAPLLPDDPPWQQGYALADELRKVDLLPAKATNPTDVAALCQAVGIQIEDDELADGGLRGVSVAGPRHRSGILVNRAHEANRYPSGRRFTIAHELCHILYDRTRSQRLAIASGPWAPRDLERRANAFAAMLLMPTPMVADAVREVGAVGGLDEVVKIAKRLDTSVEATLSHLQNLGFIDEEVGQRCRVAMSEIVSERARGDGYSAGLHNQEA